jgi:hypothetical protein
MVNEDAMLLPKACDCLESPSRGGKYETLLTPESWPTGYLLNTLRAPSRKSNTASPRIRLVAINIGHDHEFAPRDSLGV